MPKRREKLVSEGCKYGKYVTSVDMHLIVTMCVIDLQKK